MDQDEIERLLQQTQAKKDPSGPAPAPPSPAATGEAPLALDQSEIEALLSSARPPAGGERPTTATAGGGTPAAEPRPAAAARAAGPAGKAPSDAGDSQLARGDVEFLLHQAQAALASIDSPSPSNTAIPAMPFHLQEFRSAPPSSDRATLDLLRDVDLDLKIELGRTHMYLEDVLKLRKGSVVPLDKLAGDPVDIYVNGRLIARGEVLVLNDNFCVRVAELIAGETVKAAE
jgi:flagellar motor switch protein FliN/FliY